MSQAFKKLHSALQSLTAKQSIMDLSLQSASNEARMAYAHLKDWIVEVRTAARADTNDAHVQDLATKVRELLSDVTQQTGGGSRNSRIPLNPVWLQRWLSSHEVNGSGEVWYHAYYQVNLRGLQSLCPLLFFPLSR
ncbi:hypothetical protein JCM10207_001353 [Rhodosporidiobolus poonsookiae]